MYHQPSPFPGQFFTVQSYTELLKQEGFFISYWSLIMNECAGDLTLKFRIRFPLLGKVIEPLGLNCIVFVAEADLSSGNN